VHSDAHICEQFLQLTVAFDVVLGFLLMSVTIGFCTFCVSLGSFCILCLFDMLSFVFPLSATRLAGKSVSDMTCFAMDHNRWRKQIKDD